eukprot:2523825-Karenia_brevis.AAC.1
MTKNKVLAGYIKDDPKLLFLRLFTDADFAGGSSRMGSTSGGFSVLGGPNSFFPIMWLCKRQTATSRSTTETEMISMAASLFSEGLTTLQLCERLLGGKVDSGIEQNNQASILVAKAGYSQKLRHGSRTHKADLGSIKEVLDRDSVSLRYIISADRAADIFTKPVAPQ